MLNGTDQGNMAAYIEHIGIFFFFVACAGVSIIVWVFNWICWLNQCCCCDFLHNPINKRFVWWTSFIFLLGILACCISGFVTTNRFGFSLQGAQCSFNRFYYDVINGQLKDSEPKWNGTSKIIPVIQEIQTFVSSSSSYSIDDVEYTPTNCDSYIDYLNISCGSGLNIYEKLGIIVESYEKAKNSLKYIQSMKSTFDSNIATFLTKFNDINGNGDSGMIQYKNQFLEDEKYYYRVFKGWLQILTMVYYCLLLSATTFAGVSLMFYTCLRNQSYLRTFMHILWNIIRFFMFSYFFYGAAYGMLYLGLRDAVALMKWVFGENLTNSGENYPLKLPKGNGKEFLQFCLLNDTTTDFSSKLDERLKSNLNDLLTSLKILQNIQNDANYDSGITTSTYYTEYSNLKSSLLTGLSGADSTTLNDLMAKTQIKGGLFATFDCGFLRNDANMIYTSIYDLSIEARIECALSCCIGFFGAVAVYFFLFSLHHYDRELFNDSSRSIFHPDSMLGDGGNPRRKKHGNNDDPSYRKKKIRAEVELSSRNEDFSNYGKKINDDE